MREAAPPRRRPSDAEIDAVRRELLPNGLERVILRDGSRGLLKVGGFWQSDVERLLYERLLTADLDRSPKLLASGEGWVLLEELEARPATLDDAPAAFAGLAEIHRRHAGARIDDLDVTDDGSAHAPRLLLTEAPLSTHCVGDFARGVDALRELVARAAADVEAWELDAACVSQAELLGRWARDRGPALFDSGPPTLLHGDFQRGNWILTSEGIRFVDWELAAVGPGILDLYYLDPDGRGVGHAPAGDPAIEALAAYDARLGPELLRDAIVWGAIAQARLRLGSYYGLARPCRAPRAELPGAAAAALARATRYAGTTTRR